MSRIGKQPIDIPQGVEVRLEAGEVIVKGSKGEMRQRLLPGFEMKVEKDQLIIIRNSKEPASALHGLLRSLIANALEGVSQGFEKRLELEGTGYRVKKEGEKLILSLGFSHPVVIQAIPGITFEIEGEKEIIVRGIDKGKVGQAAANIRKERPPEPYKGKGIRYKGEVVRRKPGKAAKVGAAQQGGT